MNFHVLGRREFAVEAGVLKDNSEALADRVLMRLRVDAVERDGAAGGAQQRGEHFDGGGLPCSVGSKEGKDFTSRNVERDVIDGGERAKCLNEVLHPDQCERPPRREIQY